MTTAIGTAGWSIPRANADAFPTDGTALQRYAARFNAVEINSSFHRPHRRDTWQRWGDSVPADFRFAAKLPKAITHAARLIADALLIAYRAARVAADPARAPALAHPGGWCMFDNTASSAATGDALALMHALAA